MKTGKEHNSQFSSLSSADYAAWWRSVLHPAHPSETDFLQLIIQLILQRAAVSWLIYFVMLEIVPVLEFLT